ncbi:DUF2252 family protein, partial [Bradyrhizobium jicamae]|uniref:DUF2252 family protein n=1 Tax=Bradyrhizobium jicamae TaxID=280332 RepID=UPI001BA889A4
HTGNLGPLANADGDVEIEIRDLDQTVISNPAYDLIRLALSLAMTARGSDLPGIVTEKIIEQMVAGYREALSGRPQLKDRPSSIRLAMKKAVAGSWKKLAKRSIEDTKPYIPRGHSFWDLSRREEGALKKLILSDEVVQLATLLRSRESNSDVTLLDAAYWRRGCSSLGLLRSAVLLGVDAGDEHSYCLLDIKQAVKPAAPSCKGAKITGNNAARVVEGASKLSPFLGKRMIACSLLGRDVFVRELLPQDLKLDIENLKPREAVHVGRYLAAVVGRAHARQMDTSTRENWRTELGRARSKSLDAPSWLWASVLSLIAKHETAYLEHCRHYAGSSKTH